MPDTLKRTQKHLVLIGMALGILASILSLFLLIQLLWVLPNLPVITDAEDPNAFLSTLYRILYWFFNLIAVGTGFLTSLSGRGYALTYLIQMMILTLSSILGIFLFVWYFILPGFHHNLLWLAKNVLYYGAYVAVLPVFGMVSAVIMFRSKNKNVKTI